MNRLFFLCLFVTGWMMAAAQNDPQWDDTQARHWPAEFKVVEIPSSLDGEVQKAYFKASEGARPMPLVVSLHTWSGDYRQQDPLIAQIQTNNWNYIHPDFRGPNNTPKACGSEYVVADIDDAIQFALDNARVDRDNIHVIGVSGGGFATMLAYMKSIHSIRSFSSWVGISDLERWYDESLGRGNKYAGHIALATTGSENRIDRQEARRRSPMWMETPVEKRHKSKLYLYAGVHDGYTGSVPITHTIDFYNKVVCDLGGRSPELLVSAGQRETLLRERRLPAGVPLPRLGGRQVWLSREFSGQVKLTVFEGAHEMLTDVALEHVPSRGILAIGDSNGAAADGWVVQLQKLRFQDVVVNTCRGGNTMGFDNLERTELNTLRELDGYVGRAVEMAGQLTDVVILLGTNDCKAEFDKRQDEVVANLETLIRRIQSHELLGEHSPRILVVSPPPYGPDEQLAEKYQGAAKRVTSLVPLLREAASRNGCRFLDIHSSLMPVFPYINTDGVHLSEDGQKIIAKMINQALETE